MGINLVYGSILKDNFPLGTFQFIGTPSLGDGFTLPNNTFAYNGTISLSSCASVGQPQGTIDIIVNSNSNGSQVIKTYRVEVLCTSVGGLYNLQQKKRQGRIAGHHSPDLPSWIDHNDPKIKNIMSSKPTN